MMAEPVDLHEYLRQHPYKGSFSAEPHYSLTGDFVDCFTKDAKFYCKQLSPYVKLYLEFGTNEVVGVQVSGITDLVLSHTRRAEESVPPIGCDMNGKPIL